MKCLVKFLKKKHRTLDAKPPAMYLCCSNTHQHLLSVRKSKRAQRKQNASESSNLKHVSFCWLSSPILKKYSQDPRTHPTAWKEPQKQTLDLLRHSWLELEFLKHSTTVCPCPVCSLPIHVWMIITKSKRGISSTVLLIGCLACKTFKWAAKIKWLHLQSEINKPKIPIAEKGDKMCRRNIAKRATLISSKCYIRCTAGQVS